MWWSMGPKLKFSVQTFLLLIITLSQNVKADYDDFEESPAFIVAIVFGVFIIVAIIVAVIAVCCFRKRHQEMQQRSMFLQEMETNNYPENVPYPKADIPPRYSSTEPPPYPTQPGMPLPMDPPPYPTAAVSGVQPTVPPMPPNMAR